MKYTAIAAALLALFVAGFYLTSGDGGAPEPSQLAAVEGAPLVAVALPSSLSEQAQIGERIFEANCATCHGINAVGRNGIAPPLVHIIYEPSHHGDEAFQRAVAQGVRGHHWPFGNMAPVPGLTRADVDMVVSYVRELQRANGIN